MASTDLGASPTFPFSALPHFLWVASSAGRHIFPTETRTIGRHRLTVSGYLHNNRAVQRTVRARRGIYCWRVPGMRSGPRAPCGGVRAGGSRYPAAGEGVSADGTALGWRGKAVPWRGPTRTPWPQGGVSTAACGKATAGGPIARRRLARFRVHQAVPTTHCPLGNRLGGGGRVLQHNGGGSEKQWGGKKHHRLSGVRGPVCH